MPVFLRCHASKSRWSSICSVDTPQKPHGCCTARSRQWQHGCAGHEVASGTASGCGHLCAGSICEGSKARSGCGVGAGRHRRHLAARQCVRQTRLACAAASNAGMKLRRACRQRADAKTCRAISFQLRVRARRFTNLQHATASQTGRLCRHGTLREACISLAYPLCWSDGQQQFEQAGRRSGMPRVTCIWRSQNAGLQQAPLHRHRL